EEEFSFDESFAPIFERNPFAAVPDDYAARAVVAGWDHSLEVAVLERVIFDSDRESLVVLIVARTAGDGPRSEHTVHLEAEIVMKLSGRVLVHDEESSRHGRHGADRLGRAVRRPLRAIGAEAVGLRRRWRRVVVATCGHDRHS